MSGFDLRRVNASGDRPFWLLSIPGQLVSVAMDDVDLRDIINQFIAQGGELSSGATAKKYKPVKVEIEQ